MIPTRYRACAAQPWSLREPSMRSGTSKRKWKSSTHRLIIIKCSQSWILDQDPAPPQVEELTNLKKIAEKQLEEALESLQAEREQRYLACLLLLDCNAIVVDGDRGTSERSAWRISWFWPLHDIYYTMLWPHQVCIEEGAGQQEQLRVNVPAWQPCPLHPG